MEHAQNRVNALKQLLETKQGANGDFDGENLSWRDLSKANLAGARLTNTILFYTNLSGANLAGADFGGANLYFANLRGADLRGANLSQALDLYKAVVYGALCDKKTKLPPGFHYIDGLIQKDPEA